MQSIKPVIIENQGDEDLNLTGDPIVDISGDSDFSLDLTGLTSPISGHSSGSFNIIFEPTTIGAKSATVSIVSNDEDENPYTFTVQGNGVEAQEMNIKVDGADVPNNGTYDFGDVVIS